MEIGQGQKTLIPVFSEFLIAIGKYIFLEGETVRQVLSQPNLRILQYF